MAIKDRRKNNPDVKSGLFLKNPSIAGVFIIKTGKLFFQCCQAGQPMLKGGYFYEQQRHGVIFYQALQKVL
ncbi:MAG: hypothetical protein H6577_11980 [Lewinellaceae bacterium]|nr:hypothetical protein [Lewinellaceae bacterium]